MHEPKKIQVRQAVGAAVIGNVLEWYDFAVYAYLAGVRFHRRQAERGLEPAADQGLAQKPDNPCAT